MMTKMAKYHLWRQTVVHAEIDDVAAVAVGLADVDAAAAAAVAAFGVALAAAAVEIEIAVELFRSNGVHDYGARVNVHSSVLTVIYWMCHKPASTQNYDVDSNGFDS